MIAVELAHDSHDEANRPKVLGRHGAIGRQQRLVQPADLKRDEILRRLGPAAGENRTHDRAHALLRHPDPRRNLGDCDAAVQKADDQPFPLGLGRARRAARLDRPVAGLGGGRNGGCGHSADSLFPDLARRT